MALSSSRWEPYARTPNVIFRGKRLRAPNFTSEEKQLLMEIIDRHKHVFGNTRINRNKIELKIDAWLQVATEFNMGSTIKRNWKSLRYAYENNKQKMKKENLVLSEVDRESDGQTMDEPVQMPSSVALDVGQPSPNAGRSSVKIKKPAAEEALITFNNEAFKGKTYGRGLIKDAATIPLEQWENMQSVHHEDATDLTGVEPVDFSAQLPSSVPEPNAIALGRCPPVLSTLRPANCRMLKCYCEQQKRTAFHKRMACDRRSQSLVELTLIKRRYYLRLMDLAEEQRGTKLRAAEMAEEQHVRCQTEDDRSEDKLFS